MTTLWADGFDDTTVANLANDYTVTNTPLSVSGRRAGSNAISLPSACRLVRATGGTPSTIFLSCAVFLTTYGTSAAAIFRFQETGTVHVSMTFVSVTGQLRIARGDMTTTLATSVDAPIPLNVWTFMQMKVVISDTVGEVDVRDANGTVILAVSGVDTKNGGTGFVNQVQIGPGTGGPVASYDDLHIWDNAGSVCNTFTNDTRVDAIYPSGAGDSTQFTPSTGANWQCVDEQSASAADYVESATAAHQDLYAATNLAHNPVSIFGIVRTAAAQKDDAGSRSLKLLTKSGSTVSAGASQMLTLGTSVRLSDVQETDPNTSAAWTKAGVDAMQIGFENV